MLAHPLPVESPCSYGAGTWSEPLYLQSAGVLPTSIITFSPSAGVPIVVRMGDHDRGEVVRLILVAQFVPPPSFPLSYQHQLLSSPVTVEGAATKPADFAATMFRASSQN